MADLSGGSELAALFESDPGTALLIQRVINAHNAGMKSLGGAGVGQLPKPTPPNAVTATPVASGDGLQITIDDHNTIDRNVRYLSEYSVNDPSFVKPIPIDHGATRTSFLALPSMAADGTPHDYYVRTIRQMPGSPPSEPVYHGGAPGVPVNLSGSWMHDFVPSTGSGTASNNGSQGGAGLGVYPTRGATGPKREIS